MAIYWGSTVYPYTMYLFLQLKYSEKCFCQRVNGNDHPLAPVWIRHLLLFCFCSATTFWRLTSTTAI